MLKEGKREALVEPVIGHYAQWTLIPHTGDF